MAGITKHGAFGAALISHDGPERVLVPVRCLCSILMCGICSMADGSCWCAVVLYAAALDLGLPITERVIRVHQCFKYGTVRNKSGNLYLCSSLLAFDYDDSEAPKAVQGSSGSTRNTVGQSSSAVAGDAGGSVAATTLGCSRTADSSAGVLLAVGSRMVIRYQDIIHLRQEKASWADKHWLMIQFSGPQGHAALAELGGGSQGMVADILADISRIMAAAGH